MSQSQNGSLAVHTFKGLCATFNVKKKNDNSKISKWVETKIMVLVKKQLAKQFFTLFKSQFHSCKLLTLCLNFRYSSFKVVHHFRKIGGYIDGHLLFSLVLVFISPRCLEPVGLTEKIGSKSHYVFWSRVFLIKKKCVYFEF